MPSFQKIIFHFNKQQAFDADPKAKQQINFTGNLDQAWNATEQAK